MDSYDIDLEDLDLKSVDINPSITVTSPSNFKNVSFNSSSSFKPVHSFSNSNSNNPNLTISNNNNDPMPSFDGLSSDKEVDFGLNLLVNKKKQKPESEINKLGSNNPSPTFGSNKNSFNNNSYGNSNMPQQVNIDDSEFLQKSLFDDNFSNIDLDKELNSMDLNDITPPKPSMSGPSLPNFSSSNTFGNNNFGISSNNNGSNGSNGGNGSNGNSNSYGNGNSYSGGSINTGGVSSTENLSFEEIQKRKFDLLCKFERLRDKGVKLPKTFSMSSVYEEMSQEYERLVYHRKMENSVKMQRRMLVSFASMAEFVNNKTGNPFDVNLDGWSEHMNEEIQTYDEIFENLYDKHKDTIDMAPELKLVFMVASSAFWFHISNNMAKSVMPNVDMNKIFKQNPDLMNQFKNATMGSMSQTNPGFTNLMGSMGSMGGGGPPKYNPMGSPPFSNPRDAPPRGSTNINSSDDIDALIDSINA